MLLPAVDLLEGMLLLDPETRLTAKQGLSHAFLAEYHDPESEPDSGRYDDSFESLELAVGEWKSEYEGAAGSPIHPLTAALLHPPVCPGLIRSDPHGDHDVRPRRPQ